MSWSATWAQGARDSKSLKCCGVRPMRSSLSVLKPTMPQQLDLATKCDASSPTEELVPDKADTIKSRRNLIVENISASKVLTESRDGDSGYGTGTTTTPKTEKDSSTASKSERASSIGRLLRLAPKYGNLLEYDQAVSKETVDHFKRIVGRLEVALVDYMRKHFNTHYPMSIRLMILGNSSEEAKPWIVVFCHEKRERRTRRFFKKRFAQDQCQQSFEVLVVGHALQTTGGSAVDVMTDCNFATETLSGAPIRLLGQDQAQRGTLGGLIKIIDAEGGYEVCGLTAGHLVVPASKTPIESFSNSEESGEIDSDLCPSEDEDEDEESHDQTRSNNGVLVRGAASHVPSIQDTKPPAMAYWTPFGHVDKGSAPSSDGDGSDPSARDWALITIHRQADLKPNLLRARSAMKDRAADLAMPTKEKMDITTTRHVLLNSSGKECQLGSLSPLPCSVWLGHHQGFVNAFPLKMGEDSGKP